MRNEIRNAQNLWCHGTRFGDDAHARTTKLPKIFESSCPVASVASSEMLSLVSLFLIAPPCSVSLGDEMGQELAAFDLVHRLSLGSSLEVG